MSDDPFTAVFGGGRGLSAYQRNECDRDIMKVFGNIHEKIVYELEGPHSDVTAEAELYGDGSSGVEFQFGKHGQAPGFGLEVHYALSLRPNDVEKYFSGGYNKTGPMTNSELIVVKEELVLSNPETLWMFTGEFDDPLLSSVMDDNEIGKLALFITQARILDTRPSFLGA